MCSPICLSLFVLILDRGSRLALRMESEVLPLMTELVPQFTGFRIVLGLGKANEIGGRNSFLL